ncbi:hypothetical protein JCM10296v2_001990 [Rhodotorula toruloides]
MSATFPSSPEPTHPALPPYRLSALLQAHTSDVRSLSVAPLPSSPQLFSASRDGAVRLWIRNDGGGWTQEWGRPEGHEGFPAPTLASGCSRATSCDISSRVTKDRFAVSALLPEEADSTLFASGSNDGTIRLWDWRTDTALSILGEQGSFVYSLSAIPSVVGGGLASSGEDGIVKMWNEEGKQEQQVWCLLCDIWTLATLPNGDLACGCSDHMIWIFTRDEKRLADEETVRIYEERVESFRASKAPAMGKPRVEAAAALEQPGKAEGEVKLVQADGEPWDGSNWVELGEVVDRSSAASDKPGARSQPREKMLHEGVEYDYVFQVDVKDDEPPIPLPFHLEDEPHAVAGA